MIAPVHIRAATVEDVPLLLSIVEAIPSLPQWTAAQFHHVLESDKNASLVHATWLAQVEGVTAGFASASLLRTVQPGEAELENLAVAPQYRRLGIARALLATVTAWAGATGPAILRLEVRSGNREALALYAAAGFALTGTRRAYYTVLVEDAVCMELRL